MSEQLISQSESVLGVAASITASLEYAKVDKSIAKELSQIPGLQEIAQDLVARAGAASTAIGQIISSIDLAAAKHAGESGASAGSPIKAAGLKAGVASLGAAVSIGPLIDRIEKMLNDPNVRAALKKGAADKGLTGGVDDVRGALKSVSPSTVALSGHIRQVIASIHAQSHLAKSPDAKAALTEAEAETGKILETFNHDIVRLMAVTDAALGGIFC